MKRCDDCEGQGHPPQGQTPPPLVSPPHPLICPGGSDLGVATVGSGAAHEFTVYKWDREHRWFTIRFVEPTSIVSAHSGGSFEGTRRGPTLATATRGIYLSRAVQLAPALAQLVEPPSGGGCSLLLGHAAQRVCRQDRLWEPPSHRQRPRRARPEAVPHSGAAPDGEAS